ncbi:MAG: hypothetical protein ACTSUE_19010 [Promethearchaeota archaeon]
MMESKIGVILSLISAIMYTIGIFMFFMTLNGIVTNFFTLLIMVVLAALSIIMIIIGIIATVMIFIGVFLGAFDKNIAGGVIIIVFGCIGFLFSIPLYFIPLVLAIIGGVMILTKK